MANNHMGDVSHGLLIIQKFSKFIKMFPQFNFAFKFQMRHITTFIHKDHRNDLQNNYVKRFKETELSLLQFKLLKDKAEELGFITICTAFDQISVDRIVQLQFDAIKIASCSFTDWNLLNKIVLTNLPIIASTGGTALDEIDNVVQFLEHRNKDFSLLHCVGEYPTYYPHLQLNQIKLLKKKYPHIQIGFSSHQDPEQSIQGIEGAIYMGATIFERHVAIETTEYKKNDYSSNLDQTQYWLDCARETLQICGVQNERHISSQQQIKDLNKFKRGAFLLYDAKKGDIINRSDVYYAWPATENQVLANDMSKYSKYKLLDDVYADKPLLKSQSNLKYDRQNVWYIVQSLRKFLKDNCIKIPNGIQLQISHHQGIENFDETGLILFTIVNDEYCKKTLITLPGQSHPEQFHKQKKQTFIVVSGQVDLYLDGKLNELKQGDIITVQPNVRHSWYSRCGCVIQEISSTHNKNDSFYTSPVKSDRKTFVTYWKE